MKKILMVILSVCLIVPASRAVVPTDKKIRLNDGWMFLQSDIGNIWEAVRPKQKEDVPIWKAVTLPHCFNATDAVDPDLNYYQGPGWYKTQLDLDNPYPDGRILLDFEGAGQKAEVYVYMTKVGSHVGGYDEWFVDITDAVAQFRKSPDAERFKGKVPVAIRCDNSRDAEMIPSDLSDFNLYGGLYRYVNLVYVPRLSLENVYLDARVDDKGAKGTLKVSASFYNPTHFGGEASLQVRVTDPFDKVVFDEEVKLDRFDGEIQLSDVELKKPYLWSDKHPDLYTCKVTLHTPQGDLTTHDRFGFRHIEFVENGPFMLNGERVLLKGTHRHEDHAGVAAALTEDMMRDEIRMIKEMGANFIRLGHYQQSSIALALCDSLGIMVWEEIPWCRGGLGGEVYKEQGRRMLTNMVRQHRNHPSVILWGMGNENDWPGDFPDFDKEAIRAYMKELHDLAYKLDGTRMTTIRRCEFCKDIVDVYSPSVWPGWYRGRFTDYKNATWYEMNRTPRYLHVEWGGDSHARRFSENPYKTIDPVDTSVEFIADPQSAPYTGKINVPNKGDWSESYICDLFDWILKEQETMPWLTGAANWTFKDFSTPLRPENPVPYVNQKGLVERDQTPKESYYVFQSYWADKPMIRIFGHEWVRSGEKGEPRQIRVYSNCDEVELWVNGRSQGVRKRDSQDYPAAGLRWDCVLNDGINEVKAVGRKGKGKNAVTVEDRLDMEYQSARWGDVARIDARVVEKGDGYVWVEAQLKDADGVRCLDAADYIEFDYAGDGKMVYNLGTSTACRRLQAYNGRARIKVEQPAGGKGVMVVKSEGLPSFVLNL